MHFIKYKVREREGERERKGGNKKTKESLLANVAAAFFLCSMRMRMY